MTSRDHLMSRSEETLRSLNRLRRLNDVPSLIITAVSLVEALADHLLRSLTAESNASAAHVSAKLSGASMAEIPHESWEAKHNQFKTYNVRVAGTPAGQKFQLVVEVRNALVHGNGYLTMKQGKSVGALIGLRRDFRKFLDCDIQKRQLHFGGDTGSNVMSICAGYIVHLDSAVAGRGEIAPSSGI